MNHERRSMKNAVRHAIECDDARVSMPYEHCVTVAASIALVVGALLTPRRELAVAQGAAAGFLLFRSLSGRDGLRSWVGAGRARPGEDPLASPGTAEPGYSGG